jgi:hypothetical protein
MIPENDWVPTVSGNAELTLSTRRAAAGVAAEGGVATAGVALCMDYVFHDAGGFVVARRALQRTLSADYSVQFRVCGRGAIHALELKLIDAANQNVWRHVIRELTPSPRWKRLRVPSREVEFGWGPAGARGLADLGFVEFAIVAVAAGAGTLCIADLAIENAAPAPQPLFSASSALAEGAADRALTGGWKPAATDRRPWLVIDLQRARRLGGLSIDWLGAAPAAGFRVRVSGNGRRFRTLYTAVRAGGARADVYLPGLTTRFLRLESIGPIEGAALTLQPFEYSRSIEDFWYHIAATAPRGWHPRWLHREQSVWTPIGTSHGSGCALMNGDGLLEAYPGAFSLEPMLWMGGRLITWADVAPRQSLADDCLPVPGVAWATAAWRLDIVAEATVSGLLRVRYRLENLGGDSLDARLFLVVRPFQVTPPWQSFRSFGGVHRIRDLWWRDGAVCVDESTWLLPLAPAEFGAAGFDEGGIVAALGAGRLPANAGVHDPFGFASGAMAFDLTLAPHQAALRTVLCMPPGAARPAAAAGDEPAFDWRAKLPMSQWSGNGWITEAVLAALTATAHVLVTRVGAALQPGPRRYTRSWIRDGAMMGAALLRMGCVQEVREFILWYAPHQRADGFVPCCVDALGVDWLVEHDSHGELVALIADHQRFAPDRAFLESVWIHVERAVGCIEALLGPDGLLPVSVSHEGYLAQPVHSYWDDFWALAALRDAVALARSLGREETAQHWQALAARFAASLFSSIEATRAARHLAFIPGSIEWADFDPTATANAVYLLGVPAELDRAALDRTFDLYLADWRRRRSAEVPAQNYTPYEIRIIGALVRLGRREAALELLRFFLSDRRPVAWNQWPEIAWLDPASPAHVGDLPHTWIAAEYVLAVRSLFAYERENGDGDGAVLVVAAGLAAEWLDGAGVRVRGMPTAYGSLSYSLRRIDALTLRFEIEAAWRGATGSSGADGGGADRVRAGGVRLLLAPPLAGPLRRVAADGGICERFDATSAMLLPGARATFLLTVEA